MFSISYSDAIKKLPPYLFAEIDRAKKALIEKGMDIISFGVGDPDTPTPNFIIEAMKQALHNPAYHQYPFGSGLNDFRRAAAAWCARRFGITLDASSEVHALIGSKEGIGHFPFAFVNRGDVVLCPEPGYPVYNASTIFAGGTPYFMPLVEKNGFLPDLDAIPIDVLSRAKILFLNYPNNPTGATCSRQFFEKVVAFAQQHNIIVAHDAAYSEMYYDGEKPMSFLGVDGAKEVGVEFHSLSKTFSMTGWRIGFVVGNKDIIKGLATVKDNVDSGVFSAIQAAGIAALEKGDAAAEALRQMYQKRRDVFVDGMRKIGWDVRSPKATFYVWTKVPKGYTSASCASALLEQTGIVVTPGNGFGPSGEGYVRFTLTVNETRMQDAFERMKKWR